MEWINADFNALPKVISGANDFAAAFSVESILKLLHDFECVDLVKFREKLPQFLDALMRTMCGSRTGGWSLPCVMSD
jgi:glutaredoxin 2